MYTIKGTIWIEGKKGTYLGSGRIMLLEKIKETGSIAEAAKEMKMSYRHAWELIESMNRQSRNPVVIRTTGGAGGGGTVVTEEGEKVIRCFRDLYKRFYEFNREQTQNLDL